VAYIIKEKSTVMSFNYVATNAKILVLAMKNKNGATIA